MSQLSVKLDELLLDDCHVRYALRLLKELSGDLALRAKAIEQSLSSRTRFLPTIGNPAELAAVEAAKAELAKALDNLVQWPGLLDRLAFRLAALLRALGQARNMASSGYDSQRRALSPAANAFIELALVAARDLDEMIATVNDLADRHQRDVMRTPQATAVLPRVPVVGFQIRIERVRTLGITEVQAEFNRILEMCEMLETIGLVGLREATERVAAMHSDLGSNFLKTYLGQLRAYMDEHRLVPEQVPVRIHRLQLRHLGAVNFPFELGV